MSVIRQRSKNLLLSGLTGFLIGLILVMLFYLFMVRGNEKILNLLLKDSNFQVTQKVETNPIIMKKVFSLTTSVKKGDIVTQDMILSMEVDERFIPSSSLIDINTIIGKKSTIDIEPVMIITKAMVQDIDVYEIAEEIVEIHDIRVPEILSVGDKINLRIHYPTGQDYSVINDKELIHINHEDNTFFIAMTDEEILSYSSAREDGNLYAGTKMYVTRIDIYDKNISDDEGQEALVKGGLEYSPYPLNPNAQSLSLVQRSDEHVLEKRKILDDSLEEFFDQEGFLFNYELIEIEEVIVVEEADAEENEAPDEDTSDSSSDSNEDMDSSDKTSEESSNEDDSATSEADNDSSEVGESQEEVVEEVETIDNSTTNEEVDTNTDEEESTDFNF